MAALVAVVGPGTAADGLARTAEEVGALLARRGVGVVCGGLGGVMEAACRGARSAGGLTVGLLPGSDRAAANAFVTVAVPTGLGEARNVLVVRSAIAVIAVGGAYGTLSEIAFALKVGTPVVGLATWQVPRPTGRTGAPGPVRAGATDERTDDAVLVATGPSDAVRRALAAAGHRPPAQGADD